ncbi:hypothetical protein [Thiomicrorhabdus lithotrophica]|uniref:Uncharacterized protein n=1 Tax=Thiomicrorhabdus lithotrophica TaxID=2949997 RepID=A0ABY8CBW1_9GAMM|nr:hypothetical protein [Thiomicrorhabdus lithotrophica]WEJ61608.1 hypothetical protein NR989_06215 [Thiomicrorhabdus lithotrophica]
MNVQIQIPEKVLKELLVLKALHPSDITCLNNDSRNLIREYCLALCTPRDCYKCSMQDLCGEELSLYSKEIKPSISILANSIVNKR